ncbi:MAG TPA: DinB family protein [Vicinamibacterales bacterium]|jgi:uncharacterized damage-inducible protein DinB|nr:DinB family protein [Vicinamibacterales bacterium]
MTIAELLLPEVDQEIATTRRVLERVPDDKLGWKPHDKSWSMGDLASHLANLIKWTGYTMNRTEFDLAAVPPEELNQAASSRTQLLEWFDANAAAARQALAKGDADYVVPWSLKQGLNHLVHHRAQLAVYLRLNNIPVPAMYGPSADEWN